MTEGSCPACGVSNADHARFCSSCGAALSAQPLEGERRLATVLFADVVGSTAIAEQLDPEDWTQIMNGAFGLMNAAVTRFDGTVVRLLGDAILALFGAPVAHEDDAERAVRAALALQDDAREFAGRVAAEYGVGFALRVGIATGTVVLTVVGDDARSEYTAIGDAANVAARLQQLARPGTVAVDAATRRLVHPLVDDRPMGRANVRGKSEPVECFEVIGVRAVPGSVRGLEGLHSPVVGRERELAVLRSRLADLTRGVGAVIALVGEAGLGKSRLIAELRAGARDAVWLETRAISYGQSIPYHPWRQLGRLILGAPDADPPDALQARLRDLVADRQLAASDLPLLETMMGVATDESLAALDGLDGDEVIAGAANAVVSTIRSLVQADGGTPHVIVLEDLHWADHASLELLAEVAPLAVTEPLLLVCAMRPDRRSGSAGLAGRLEPRLGDRFVRIDLEPLDRSGSEQLLGNLLSVRGLGDGVRTLILDRAEGNPFYLEEVLRSLIDSGYLHREGSEWRVTGEIADAQIPETLAGVLSARIDRLPDRTKRVAQTASVIGRVFAYDVLQTVCRAAPHPVASVDPDLETLSWEQLVRERTRDPEREYAFSHALTCEAAYSLLLRSRRRQLHALAGSALESMYPRRRAEFAPVLAHHFREARDDVRALEYYRIAADGARRLYALTEELQHREQILRIADRRGTLDAAAVDDVLEWVLTRHRLNRYAGVIDRLTRTLEAARALGDERRVAELLSWIGNVHMVTGMPTRSVPYLVESREIANRLGDDRLMLLPLWVGTWSLVDRDPAAAVPALREVVELARRENVADVEAHATGELAVAYARLGLFDEAHEQIRAALERAPHAGSPVKEADVHIAVGQAYREMGELDDALTHARIGAEGALAADGVECACAGFYGVGRTELELHEYDHALGDFERALSLADRAHTAQSAPFLTHIRAGHALAAFRRGDTTSVDGLRRSIGDAQRSGDDFGVGVISEQLAGALSDLGERDEAGGHLDVATGTFRRLGARPFLVRALEATAALKDALGDRAGADAARTEASGLRQELAPVRESAREA